ncbi:MAG: TolC family protein [Sandaracinaceae bacterium]
MTATAFVVLDGCVPAVPQGAMRDVNDTTPDAFRATAGDEGTTQPNTGLVSWTDYFTDPHLVALIDEALQHNQELNIAVQENFIASYEVMARRGEIMPMFNVGAGGGVEHVSEASSQGASDEQAGLDPNLQSYSVGVFASWEIDIWNRLRNLADAAANQYLASVEGRHFMITVLVSEIASLYYELMSLDRQLVVVNNSVTLQEDALNAVRLQFQAAQTTSLAVARFEAELLEFRSRSYEIRQAIIETENRINFLVGRFPQHVERSSADFLSLTPPPIHAGMPSDILTNRPDVRAAELQMRAARLNVDAARARYFPALSLEAGIGYSSFDILRLVDTPGSVFFAIFGNITAPLLNRTQITSGYYTADAQQRQAIIGYERAILNAYIEVVNRLSLVDFLQASYLVRERRVDRLLESIDISMRLFANAHADYLEVLTARRDSLDAQLELIETKQRQLTASVRLYQALGGGWQRPEERPAAEEAATGDEPAEGEQP